jgi:hypothetical protein
VRLFKVSGMENYFILFVIFGGGDGKVSLSYFVFICFDGVRRRKSISYLFVFFERSDGTEKYFLFFVFFGVYRGKAMWHQHGTWRLGAGSSANLLSTVANV